MALPFLLDKSWPIGVGNTPKSSQICLKIKMLRQLNALFAKHVSKKVMSYGKRGQLARPGSGREAISISLHPDSNCDLSGMFQF